LDYRLLFLHKIHHLPHLLHLVDHLQVVIQVGRPNPVARHRLEEEAAVEAQGAPNK